MGKDVKKSSNGHTNEKDQKFEKPSDSGKRPTTANVFKKRVQEPVESTDNHVKRPSSAMSPRSEIKVRSLDQPKIAVRTTKSCALKKRNNESPGSKEKKDKPMNKGRDNVSSLSRDNKIKGGKLNLLNINIPSEQSQSIFKRQNESLKELYQICIHTLLIIKGDDPDLKNKVYDQINKMIGFLVEQLSCEDRNEYTSGTGVKCNGYLHKSSDDSQCNEVDSSEFKSIEGEKDTVICSNIESESDNVFYENVVNSSTSNGDENQEEYIPIQSSDENVVGSFAIANNALNNNNAEDSSTQTLVITSESILSNEELKSEVQLDEVRQIHEKRWHQDRENTNAIDISQNSNGAPSENIPRNKKIHTLDDLKTCDGENGSEKKSNGSCVIDSQIYDHEPTLEHLKHSHRKTIASYLDPMESQSGTWLSLGEEIFKGDEEILNKVRRLRLSYCGGGSPGEAFIRYYKTESSHTVTDFREIAEHLGRNDIVKYIVDGKYDDDMNFSDFPDKTTECIAALLDQGGHGIKNWKDFAYEIYDNESIVSQFATAVLDNQMSSPTASLLKMIKSTKPNFKLSEFGVALSKIKRFDVKLYIDKLIQELSNISIGSSI